MPKRKSKMFGDAVHHVPLSAKTENQQRYLNALRTCTQVFAIGPAGTGKTFLPTAYAADLMRDKQIARIVLTRPNVPAGPSLGFFPGELEEKMAPFETMRGRTFHDSIVIVDEAQNLTESEMYMILTRIGEESQLIVTGDVVQKDIKTVSGLERAIDIINRDLVDAELVVFDHNDVVRGGITAQWVKNWSR